MSGRPSGNRGKRTRQGFERRHTSNRYTSEPPPRFANRQRNGDGRGSGEYRSGYDYYGNEDHGRGGGGGYSPHKGGRDGWGGGRAQGAAGKSNYEDLSNLLVKLEQSTEVSSSCRIMKNILEFLETADYKTNQTISRNAGGILKTFQQVIRDNSDRNLLSTLEQCIAYVGHCLGREAQRLFDWVFSSVHSDDLSDEIKTVYLNGLYEAMEMDGGKLSSHGALPYVVDSLQGVLEVAETPLLLEAVVKNIVAIAKFSPQHLSRHFKNTVDILVGWHIDIQQEASLIDFISRALVSLHDFWIKDMSFSVELLKQFLEDMEAYSSELAGVSDDLSVPPEESSTPEQCMAKLIALLRVFTTVLSALATSFSPSRSPDITTAYVQSLVSRITSYVLSASDITFSEELLIVSNRCLSEFCHCLGTHFAGCSSDVAHFIVQQLDDLEMPSHEHASSIVKLLLQTVEDLQASLPTQFAQQVFGLDSPLLTLRYTATSKLLQQMVKLYQNIFSIRNIPLLETVYRLIVSDLESAFHQLSSGHEHFTGDRRESQEAFSTVDVQAAIIFNLTVLSQVSNTSKAVLGMWSPAPTVFSLLVSQLGALSPTLASEYPAVHHALLYALFQDCRSNNYYIPGSNGSSSVSVGGTSIGHTNSPSGTISSILSLLTKQMQINTLQFDSCRLIQRWVDYIVVSLGSTNKETVSQEKLPLLLDALTCQLLAFTFSREHSIRLENAVVLKALFQSGMVNDKVILKCVPECLIRLCDTHGEIRAAYSALLEVVPTHLITSFSRGAEFFQPPNGRKGVEGVRNCKGTWHARRVHMTKQSQVTFHGHHFKAIMGFIMHGYSPSKHLPDDWLERMYHSCQHRQIPISETQDHPETHPLLMSHLVCNCDTVLWFWATYESAQYCLLARLRTPLGMPAETFTAIENVLCGYAQEVESQDGRHLRDTPSNFSGHMGAGLGPRHYTVHLRAVLLLQFMEHLDKLMYNAYEGSCVTLPPVPKSVRTFFRKNIETCLQWLSHVRPYIVSIAIHAGMPAVAIRHGFAALHDLRKVPRSVEFFRMLVQVVHALLLTEDFGAIRGIGTWTKHMIGSVPPWIVAAEHQAKGSYETACEEYIKALDVMTHSPDISDPTMSAINGPIVSFIINRVCECYVRVSEWKEVESWHSHVVALQEQFAHPPELGRAFNLHYDINQLSAMSSFESGELGIAREYIDNTADSRYPSRDPEVFPLWDPSQLLSTSQTLLLKAATFQVGEDGSGSDDTTSVTSEGEYGSKSNLQRWLKLSSAYAESPLRVGCLEWPLRASATHALQLQSAAALRALNPIRSRHAQPSSSGLLLYSTPFKSLDPAHHDSGIWSEALRIASHLFTASPSGELEDRTPSILLESYRLARNRGNLKLAMFLLQRHILELSCEDISEELNLSDLLEQMNASEDVTPIEKLQVTRELAKLNACRGQPAVGIDLLSGSVVKYSCNVENGAKTATGSLGTPSEFTARSLLTIVKWLQADSRLMQSVWSVEHDAGRKLQMLLTDEYTFRKSRLGLYQSASSSESHELFRPDESVAKFDKHEYSIGQLLHLATIQCPDLAKAWWSLAGWCYRIGRKNLEALSATGTADLLEHEQQEVDSILGDLVSPEQRSAILGVLGQIHITDDMAEEDLKDKEQQHIDMEEDSKSMKGQLLSVCPSLEKLPSLDDLLAVWHGVRVRMFMHYQLAARAYFTFLKLSGSQAGSSSGLDDMNVTASLRLLRLLVKYAGELKSELESGFATTPTKPWKGIIPQLFSRLNHPEANVRQSVSDLLCRVGQDSPHFIIYPAIVGASRRAEKEKKTTVSTGLLREESEGREENPYDSDMGSRDLIGDGTFSPAESIEQDEQGEASPVELSNLEKCLSVIIDSLKQQNPNLVKSVQDLVAELCRITLLWDEMWLAALMQRQGEVHRRLMQIDVETKRTMSIPFLTGTEREAIMREKYMATMKPLLWVLEHLAAITALPPETPNERNFQAQYGETINAALQRLRNPINYTNCHTVWEPFKEFQQVLMHRAQKRMQNSLSLHEISPHLAAISSSCITMPGHDQDDEPVTLESFQLEVAVLPTKTKPKKISMIGSDGRKHTYLFKGLEDLHLDERIMQFMAIINNMFARAHKHKTQLYHARDYAVIPLGARSGLIQWVDYVTPLFGIYKRWQQREAFAKALQQTSGSQPSVAMPLQVLKPNELFYSKIIPLLKEKGMSEQTPRKEWPHPIQLRVLKELLDETPDDLLAKELWCASTCASEWWSATQTYSRSTAVMCMIGYIIGLGDRHLDNLLVEFSTGQIVHVDYNVCFEKGRSLRVPERVPFRMTQNIETALGFTGVEGLFRISCEDILRILRRGRETLLTLLEAFVYDPLIDWTQSEEAAFPLAVRVTGDMVGRPSRKEMEREVASGMLVTRLAESGPHWQRNRENLCSVLLALELHLDEIAKTGEKLASYHGVTQQLDRQAEILRDAVNTPDHPLISMQDKLSEQSHLAAEKKHLLAEMGQKYQDFAGWNRKYKEAFVAIHGSSGLAALIARIQNPLDVGPPGHEPAVEFLQSIHQNQSVETCDQLEDELLALLQRRRATLNTALDALHQYRNITSQFHADYLKQSRSYLWQQCLEPVLSSDAGPDSSLPPSPLPPINSYHQVLEEFEQLLMTEGRPPQLVKAVDSKFRKQIQELHSRYTKLVERSKALPPVDLRKLEAAVLDTNQHLQQFSHDNPDAGPPALACFVITALCPLSQRWLFMEQTAHAARERLSDLTSRDGDWFLDELCTMSGNVSQMIGLLDFCLSAMGNDFEPGSTLRTTMDGVNAVHKVYTSMQDLINEFQSLVLPEALNYVLSEDESLLEMIDTITGFSLSTYPDLPIQDALTRLTEELRQCSLKSEQADLSTTSAVDEMRSKLSGLLVVGSPDRGSMTPAQMILNSLNGMFQISEAATTRMLEVMEEVDIPEMWESVGLIKQTQELMCTTAGLSLTEELLFVRKAQALVDFCVECRSLLKAFKLDVAQPEGDCSSGYSTPTPPGTPGGKRPSSLHVPSESALALPIRRYISDTLICHILGQPSHALACLLVSAITQYLGTPLPNGQTTVEEICKLSNDRYQSVLPMQVVQHAKVRFSQHDVAWRECDKARRLMNNLENCKQALQRTRGVTARFQWLHEETLITPDSHYPWVGPQRSILLTKIKKVLSEQMAAAITSILDKINSQQFRISQRLQWAAGANPALNAVVDEFERATNRRKQILQEEEDLYLKIYEYSEAVIHLESSHTRIPSQTTSDKDMSQLLQRCTEVTVKLQLCTEQLSQVSDIMPHIDLPEDGGPLTIQWMQKRLQEITSERSRILNDKRNDNTKLARHKESVLSELEKLRGLNRAHRKLMVEIWQHLTALARLEEPPPAGQVLAGPRGFINLQNRFGEETRSFIQCTQELIASDMSLAAKPTWTSKAKVEEYAHMRNGAGKLRILAESLLGQLLSFTEQLFQGQPCSSLKWNPPPQADSLIPKSHSLVSISSQQGQSSETAEQQQQQQKVYRSSQGIVRDKRTGKALQEQNSYAVGVWRRVKAKLDGRDPDPAYRMTVAEQVKYVIDESTSPDNLCQLYEGWTPWV